MGATTRFTYVNISFRIRCTQNKASSLTHKKEVDEEDERQSKSNNSDFG
jgi:hypothetical protein